jgi:hypothetical protein
MRAGRIDIGDIARFRACRSAPLMLIWHQVLFFNIHHEGPLDRSAGAHTPTAIVVSASPIAVAWQSRYSARR